jgi:N-acyl-D-amino-acid deacylase
MDLVFRGARLADGTGEPIVRRDVGVVGGRIASVGRPGSVTAKRSSTPPDSSWRPGSSTCTVT